MIIDVHTHIFPDELALKVVPVMAAKAGIKEAIDGRLGSLLDSMKSTGIDVSWLQPVATKPKQVDSINRWLEEVRTDAAIAFGAVHPGCEDLGGLMRHLSAKGFPGVKIHPEYHEIEPDDPIYYPLYEAAVEERMMILFHAGVDIEIPTLHSAPHNFLRIKEKFPNLTMILAHMGGFRQWQEVAKRICGMNVYLDTSYSLDHMPDEEFMALVRAHGADRILFGTDSPWADQRKDLEHLRRLPLTQDELQQICGDNAIRLLAERKY